jgi:hypothetical protein
MCPEPIPPDDSPKLSSAKRPLKPRAGLTLAVGKNSTRFHPTGYAAAIGLPPT